MLRKEWGFRGYVISDEGAIEDILYQHKYKSTAAEAVAAAVNAGETKYLVLKLVPSI